MRKRKEYVKYTDEQIAQARNTDMVDFLERQRGFTFTRRGSYYICKEHNSLNVESDRRKWHWNSRECGGLNVIDWFSLVENVDFRQALDILIGRERAAHNYTFKQAERTEVEEKKPFELPKKTEGKYNSVYSYLTQARGIDSDIVQYCFHKHVIYQDERWNCVFVGYDENETAKFAEVKPSSTDEKYKKLRFNISSSDKAYSFNLRSTVGSDRVFVFESPIDLLSHCTLTKAKAEERAIEQGRQADSTCWQRQNRLSLSGTSDVALDAYLKRYPDIQNICLCLDNDDAGQAASKKIKDKYSALGYNVSIYHSSFGKDYNDMLINHINSKNNNENTEEYDYDDDKTYSRR